jgi:hypothetical protein
MDAATGVVGFFEEERAGRRGLSIEDAVDMDWLTVDSKDAAEREWLDIPQIIGKYLRQEVDLRRSMMCLDSLGLDRWKLVAQVASLGSEFAKFTAAIEAKQLLSMGMFLDMLSTGSWRKLPDASADDNDADEEDSSLRESILEFKDHWCSNPIVDQCVIAAKEKHMPSSMRGYNAFKWLTTTLLQDEGATSKLAAFPPNELAAACKYSWPGIKSECLRSVFRALSGGTMQAGVELGEAIITHMVGVLGLLAWSGICEACLPKKAADNYRNPRHRQLPAFFEKLMDHHRRVPGCPEPLEYSESMRILRGGTEQSVLIEFATNASADGKWHNLLAQLLVLTNVRIMTLDDLLYAFVLAVGCQVTARKRRHREFGNVDSKIVTTEDEEVVFQQLEETAAEGKSDLFAGEPMFDFGGIRDPNAEYVTQKMLLLAFALSKVESSWFFLLLQSDAPVVVPSDDDSKDLHRVTEWMKMDPSGTSLPWAGPHQQKLPFFELIGESVIDEETSQLITDHDTLWSEFRMKHVPLGHIALAPTHAVSFNLLQLCHVVGMNFGSLVVLLRSLLNDNCDFAVFEYVSFICRCKNALRVCGNDSKNV